MSVFMACPQCAHQGANAWVTREHPQYNWIRRRRLCKACGHRWWTVELCEDDLEATQPNEDQ